MVQNVDKGIIVGLKVFPVTYEYSVDESEVPISRSYGVTMRNNKQKDERILAVIRRLSPLKFATWGGGAHFYGEFYFFSLLFNLALSFVS